MDNDNPLSLQEATRVKRSAGRPLGAKNYGGISLIAREMRIHGIDWKADMVESYKAYKQDKSESNKILMLYWLELMPYIAIRIEDKLGRGPKKYVKRKAVLSSSVARALERLEGRKEENENKTIG